MFLHLDGGLNHFIRFCLKHKRHHVLAPHKHALKFVRGHGPKQNQSLIKTNAHKKTNERQQQNQKQNLHLHNSPGAFLMCVCVWCADLQLCVCTHTAVSVRLSSDWASANLSVPLPDRHQTACYKRAVIQALKPGYSIKLYIFCISFLRRKKKIIWWLIGNLCDF